MKKLELKNKMLSISNNEFIDNDYLDLYCKLILNNLSTLPKRYITNKHHIIPKCLYKNLGLEIDNSIENLVNLFPAAHLLAHFYLVLCSRGSLHEALLPPLRFISGVNNLDIEKISEINLKLYEQIHIEARKVAAKKLSNYRRNMNKEQRENYKKTFSTNLKGRKAMNNGVEMKLVKPEDIENYKKDGWVLGSMYDYTERHHKIVKALTGYVRSAEYCENCILSHLGKIYINKDNKCIMIYKEHLNDYLDEGWIKGRLSRKKEK